MHQIDLIAARFGVEVSGEDPIRFEILATVLQQPSAFASQRVCVCVCVLDDRTFFHQPVFRAGFRAVG